jgi:hypothetical protein
MSCWGRWTGEGAGRDRSFRKHRLPSVCGRVMKARRSARSAAGLGSEATYYNWRKKYTGPMPSEMKRCYASSRKREQKKIVANLSTKTCCRTSSAESCEACPEASTDGSYAGDLVSTRRACRALPPQECIDDRQHPQLSAGGHLVMHEIHRPDLAIPGLQMAFEGLIRPFSLEF